VNADGSSGIDLAKSDPHGGDRYRGFIDAIWSPNGQSIGFLREEFGNSCAFVMRPNGAELRKLGACEANDDPRYWSVDEKWLVVRAQRGGLYALDVNGNQRVSLGQLGRIQLYDERYYPWKLVDQPVCKGADFWSCE
jgi:Tol biopolymer transport system component